MFLEAPQQSPALEGENISPPSNIMMADLTNIENLKQKRKIATEYKTQIKLLRIDQDFASRSDINEAEDYRIGSQIALMMPQISAASVLTNSTAIHNQLDQVIAKQNQQEQVLAQQGQVLAQQGQVLAQQGQVLVQIQAHLQALLTCQEQAQMYQVKFGNSFKVHDNDFIVPPPFGSNIPPANFPASIMAIRLLETGEELSAIENFYHLGHIGDVIQRRNTVAIAYGLRIPF
jgi:hypothetical protein